MFVFTFVYLTDLVIIFSIYYFLFKWNLNKLYLKNVLSSDVLIY